MATERSKGPTMIQTPPPPEPLTPQSRDHKKSWWELRQAVKECHMTYGMMALRVPQVFNFAEIPSSKKGPPVRRIYFLGGSGNTREQTLLYVDLPVSVVYGSCPMLAHKSLLGGGGGGGSLPWGHYLFSKEEQLMRERKRLGTLGITSYETDKNCDMFVFPASSSLFVCRPDPTKESSTAQAITSNCTGPRLDPKICPDNENLVAFINKNDIWVTNLSTDEECRLTFTHKGSTNIEDDPCGAGVPSFIIQEEFDRFTAYWWQPQPNPRPAERPQQEAGAASGSSSSSSGNVYRILFEEVDESTVDIVHIVNPVDKGTQVDKYRYPRAGTPNARSRLKILEFSLNEKQKIVQLTIKQLQEPLTTLFPWVEYIVRLGWGPCGRFVWVQVLNRCQNRLALIMVPLSCFTEIDSMEFAPLHYIQTIHEEVSIIWINVHDILNFLPSEDPNVVSFVWASERTGFRHLYKIRCKLPSEQPDFKPRDCFNILDQSKLFNQQEVLENTPLTQGDWEVLGGQVWVDSQRNLIYFMALKDRHLESHLYCVSIDKPSVPCRLTELGYSHNVTMNSACTLFVSVHSGIRTPPRSAVYEISHAEATALSSPILTSSREMALILEPSTQIDSNAPEIFNYDSQCGHTLYGLIYRPHRVQQGVKCPTVVFVYGGPQVQLVSNSFKGLRFLRLHTLASLGYAVVVIDGRGSTRRGLQFESHIKTRMGFLEIEDQVEGIEWAAKQYKFIDINRVCIHGWSYGGYLSLMALAQRPDIFKVAVAAAPVTSWLEYDTGYTERYLDTPQKNPAAYKASAVLNYVHQFPDQEHRLLIIHGLNDENVHFYHTTLLVTALIEACKPYELQVYPKERHGIRQHDASEHYETTMLSFLQEHL